ncbi:hypothetical protein BSKO_07295 [Bryopsis sp. KO-2023]|nr:hypothetical protein BSKO_07295 [Bryopsis sp. KO-2023]
MAARRGIARAAESASWISQLAFRQSPLNATVQSQFWNSRPLGLLGLGLAAAIGTASSFARTNQQAPSGAGGIFSYSHSAADARFNRHVPTGSLPEVTLFQYEVCPFCCKVRAFLDYHKVPYDVVEVNPLSKTELAWSSYKKVPVMQLGGETVTDSNRIISRLVDDIEKFSKEQKSGWFKGASLSSSDHSEEENKWRKWVDERFVRIITANIYRTWGESWQTFDYITEHGNFGSVSRHAARAFGSATMWAIGKRMPKKYSIEGDLREALYSDANEWIEAIGKRKFMGGNQPNLADLAVFGVLRAIIGTDAFADVMEHSELLPWFTRMADVVGDTSRSNPPKKKE